MPDSFMFDVKPLCSKRGIRLRLSQTLAVLVLAVVVLCSVPLVSRAQRANHIVPSYQVVSATAGEVIVKIEPKYETTIVRDSAGHEFTEMKFSGGMCRDAAGSAEVQQLVLPFLTPSSRRAQIEITSQAMEVIPNVNLAPVPTRVKRNGDVIPLYVVNDKLYNTPHYGPLFEAGQVTTFRTAYSEQVVVWPIQYEPESKTITRVKSLTLRIRFADGASAAASPDIRYAPEEIELFQGAFLNSNITQFYGLAKRDYQSSLPIPPAMKITGALGDGQWLQIETGDEGIYHITAQDLAKAGITGSIDTSTIELFGVGGEMLKEAVTASSGEWIEKPIEIHMNGQSLSDICFYAPGVSVWRYNNSEGGTEGLFHNLNPYTSTGHYLLKIGGNRLGSDLRVRSVADSITGTIVNAGNVLSAFCRENEKKMEVGNIGREMLDQDIPRSDAGSLQFAMNAPGYVGVAGDSAIVRVAFDVANAQNANSSLSVNVNGQQAAILDANALNRVWDEIFRLDPSLTAPLNFGLNFTSNNPTALATLNFVEMIYHRSTDIGSKSVSFMLLDTGAAFHYSFTNASGGELWEITSSAAPALLATASGGTIASTLQGKRSAMRRFIAFSSQSLQSPNSISKITVPTLRSGVGQAGATEIIVAPNDLLAQANELKALREQGGQATEAMSAAVVSIDDIFREFGYGSRDVTAIRDFMAYTMRHATNRPVYLTLLGTGHCDYQNRISKAPNYIPVWELQQQDFPPSFRASLGGEPYPDDWYFVHLSPNAPDLQYDAAVGRVSARNVDDAEAYVAKVRMYEHTSDSGAWRGLSTFLADDRVNPEDTPWSKDLLNHFDDTENESSFVQDRVLVNKIYDASYPVVNIAGGQRRQPTVEQAIIDAFNNGTCVFSYIGHGNPTVWAHEFVLTVPATINKLNNFDRLAYVTTGTCDFSEYDNFADFSGGEMFVLRPGGGAIGMLGTSRSVGGGEPLLDYFYQYLFQQAGSNGTSTVGKALQYSMPHGNDPHFFYLLGDPAQRLLIPKLYVSFDSLNHQGFGSQQVQLPALSQVQLSGSIREGSDATSAVSSNFDGTVTITLFDTPTREVATTTFGDGSTTTDRYWVEGPILYRGTATVTNGHFNVSFVIPRDVKLDTTSAKLSGYAYAYDTRTALGDSRGIILTSPDSTVVFDTIPPGLTIFLGSRAFVSGDVVSRHSTAIVDVHTQHGLNTSTASIGHTFIAWIDDATDSAIDMASTYVSNQNDFTSGTSVHPIELPVGRHTLHVRAFDTYDNAAFGSVEFVAKDNLPYHLYDVTTTPNPIQDHTVFTLTQPGNKGSLVRATLHIYTIDGRAIRTLTDETRLSVVEIPWDGRDITGNTVANGVYAFTIDVNDLDDGTSSQASGKCIVSH